MQEQLTNPVLFGTIFSAQNFLLTNNKRIRSYIDNKNIIVATNIGNGNYIFYCQCSVWKELLQRMWQLIEKHVNYTTQQISRKKSPSQDSIIKVVFGAPLVIPSKYKARNLACIIVITMWISESPSNEILENLEQFYNFNGIFHINTAIFATF